MCAKHSKPLGPSKGYSSDFTVSSPLFFFPPPLSYFQALVKNWQKLAVLELRWASDSRLCFVVWRPDDCVISRNMCQIPNRHLPVGSPPSTRTHHSWFVLRRGSRTPPPWSSSTYGCSLHCCPASCPETPGMTSNSGKTQETRLENYVVFL